MQHPCESTLVRELLVERWGAGVETQKNVRGEDWGMGSLSHKDKELSHKGALTRVLLRESLSRAPCLRRELSHSSLSEKGALSQLLV